MPREIRCVLFGQDEMRFMLAESLIQRIREHKGAQIGRIEIVDAPGGPQAKVHFSPPHRPALATFQTSALLEAVLIFCREHRVPLPRGALKSLQIAGGDLALLSMLRVRDEPTVSGGKVSYHDQSVRALGLALLKAAEEPADA